jgi:hypothetical protein
MPPRKRLKDAAVVQCSRLDGRTSKSQSRRKDQSDRGTGHTQVVEPSLPAADSQFGEKKRGGGVEVGVEGIYRRRRAKGLALRHFWGARARVRCCGREAVIGW